jgi:hypothetical protein
MHKSTTHQPRPADTLAILQSSDKPQERLLPLYRVLNVAIQGRREQAGNLPDATQEAAYTAADAAEKSH